MTFRDDTGGTTVVYSGGRRARAHHSEVGQRPLDLHGVADERVGGVIVEVETPERRPTTGTLVTRRTHVPSLVVMRGAQRSA